MRNNWPDEKFERGPLDAIDEKRSAEALLVVQQWQDGAIMFIEMVNKLQTLLTLEDYKAMDEMAGIKRTQFDWQVWPDQDCPHCKYVATIAGTLDVWVCDSRGAFTSLIVRYGGEPHEYASTGIRTEEYEAALVRLMNRYSTTVDLEVTRRHCIIEMVLDHLPSTILNLSSFPGKVMVTMARSAVVLNKKGEQK